MTTELEQVVVQLLLGALDASTVNESTKQLKHQLKRPATMLVLMKLLTTDNNPAIRGSAAVYLRQKIASHWKKLANAQSHIQSSLLEHIVREPE
jgi:hypothetical protein